MAAVLIDCDPGIDDAIALCLAAGCPEVELLGVTTVAGNHFLDRTTRNARAVLALAGSTVPVAAGCDRPLVRDLRVAPEIHGETGLGAGPPPVDDVSSVPLLDVHAANHIVEVVRRRPGDVTVVALGPLTNLAVALRLDPLLPERVGRVVVMGGATTRGNVTAAAEFNVWADPEAAAAVFGAPWPLTMVGLDATHQARCTPGHQQRLEATGRAGRYLSGLIGELRVACAGEEHDPAMHDPVALAAAIRPGLLRSEPARVAVETAGSHTAGMTVVDFGAEAPVHDVGTVVDVDAFWDLLADALARLGGDVDERVADGVVEGIADA